MVMKCKECKSEIVNHITPYNKKGIWLNCENCDHQTKQKPSKYLDAIWNVQLRYTEILASWVINGVDHKDLMMLKRRAINQIDNLRRVEKK